MTYEEIKTAWNAKADELNQWDELGEDEKVEWAFGLAMNCNSELGIEEVRMGDFKVEDIKERK